MLSVKVGDAVLPTRKRYRLNTMYLDASLEGPEQVRWVDGIGVVLQVVRGRELERQKRWVQILIPGATGWCFDDELQHAWRSEGSC